jgi:hypothetical protein
MTNLYIQYRDIQYIYYLFNVITRAVMANKTWSFVIIRLTEVPLITQNFHKISLTLIRLVTCKFVILTI